MRRTSVIPLMLLASLCACDGRNPAPVPDGNGAAVTATPPARPRQTGGRPATPDPRKPIAGAVDPDLQSALDAVPERMRGDVIALTACRAMSLKSAPSTEARAAALRQAAADVASDPSAAGRCMSSLGARNGPPAPRTGPRS